MMRMIKHRTLQPTGNRWIGFRRHNNFIDGMDIWADICKCRVLYPSALNVRVNNNAELSEFQQITQNRTFDI